MVFFVVSFFGTAVINRSNTLTGMAFPGYFCAEMALLSPWDTDGLKLLQDQHVLRYIALLLSGLINPVFLATVWLLQKERTGKLGSILRVVLLCMLPSCWLVFSYQGMRPFVGYYLWTTSMLVALFSNSFSKQLAGAKILKTA
jgi:hypothetical protein